MDIGSQGIAFGATLSIARLFFSLKIYMCKQSPQKN